MNRQLRRAQKKQDKKQEKEKARRVSSRRRRLDGLRGRRSAAKRDTRSTPEKREPAAAGGRSRLPGRFSGALALVTAFFIVLQAVVPTTPSESQLPSTADSFIGAAFYLMLGYFTTLWLMRRGVERAFAVSAAAGALLAAGVTLAATFQPQVLLDPLKLVLIVPALLLGVFLGRLVFLKTPA